MHRQFALHTFMGAEGTDNGGDELGSHMWQNPPAPTNNIKLNSHPWAAPKLVIRIPATIKDTTDNKDEPVDKKISAVGVVAGYGVVDDATEAENVDSTANNASDDNITDDDMPYGFKDFLQDYFPKSARPQAEAVIADALSKIADVMNGYA